MLIEPYEILKKIFDNEIDALIYLIENSYINKYEKCIKCGKETVLNLNKKLYVCKYKCRKAISPFNGTIFSRLRLL